MADNRYELDLRNFDIRKAGHDISRAVWKAVRFILTVVSLTVVGYVLFALFYSTDEEKRLKEENSRYEALYHGLPAKLDKIGEDLERLSRKDDIIYKDIFHSDPPSADPMSSLSIFFGSDSIPDPAGQHQLHPDRSGHGHQDQPLLHHRGQPPGR